VGRKRKTIGAREGGKLNRRKQFNDKKKENKIQEKKIN